MCQKVVRLDMTESICHGCDGKKFVNFVSLKSNQIFTDDIETKVRECLICRGTGKIDNGIIS